MSDIKRYDVHVAGSCCARGCNPYPDPFESADGIWVDYNDHARAVASPHCREHGDPLVCLVCEAAEEDARPEWQRPHRVTPPRLRGEPERTTEALETENARILEALDGDDCF
jgi:hypothetical protein